MAFKYSSLAAALLVHSSFALFGKAQDSTGVVDTYDITDTAVVDPNADSAQIEADKVLEEAEISLQLEKDSQDEVSRAAEEEKKE